VPEERDRQMAFETPLLPEAPHVDSPLPTLASGSAALIERLPPGPESRNSMVRVELQPGRAAAAGFFGKLVRRRGAANVTPPVPVTKTIPELPAQLRQTLSGEVRIDVRVFVTATGQVEYAELVSEAADATRGLATWAVFAARRWRFSPAISTGAAVRSEATLRFHFGPG